MKIQTLFLILCTFGIQPVIAQNISVPEFNNEVLFVNADNTLSKLEKTDIIYHFTPGVLSAAKTYYQASGCCSGISHSGKPNEQFIIKVSAGVDPESLFTLVKFESNNRQRRILINKVTIRTAMQGTNKVELPKVPLTVKKIGDGIYLLSPQEQLTDGEYGFLNNRQGFDADFFAFCFSVKNN